MTPAVVLVDDEPLPPELQARGRQMLQRTLKRDGMEMADFPFGDGGEEANVWVALGPKAFARLTGETLAFDDARGYVFGRAGRGWVIPTYHPFRLAQGDWKHTRVFNHDIKRALDVAVEGFTPYPTRYCLDPTPTEAERWADRYMTRLSVEPTTPLAYDIETPMSLRGRKESEIELDDDPSYTILRISFAFEAETAMTLPWSGEYLGVIRRLLGSCGVKIAHNGRFDDPRIQFNGIPIVGERQDTMLMWHMLNSHLEKDLGFVATFYCPKQVAWKHLAGSQPAFYSAADADVTWRIAQGLVRDLHSKGQWEVFHRHMVQLDRVLEGMTEVGVAVDQEARKALALDVQAQLDAAEAKMEEVVPVEARTLKVYKRKPKGEEGLVEFSLPATLKVCSVCGKKATKSHPHVKSGEGVLLTQPITIPVWGRPLPFKLSVKQLCQYQAVKGHKPQRSRDKARRITFDEKAVEALALKYPTDPLYPMLVARREVEKIQTTITGEWEEGRGFIGGMETVGGRIHPVFTHNPSTLRLSCVRPNAQNMASGRKGDGIQSRIKPLFIADPGHLLVEIDFSAIEAVLVGYFAGSARYMRLAKLGVHDFLAAHIAVQRGLLPSSDLPDVTWDDTKLAGALKFYKKQFAAIRPIAKMIVHSSAYGGTAHKIHSVNPDLFPTVKAARDLQNLYFEILPEIRRWQNATVDEAAQAGYLRNPYGYVHWFWNVKRWTKVQGEWVSEWAEDAKAALAFKPQSTAAGIIKEAMLRIRDAGLAGYLRLQVHDSLVFDIPERMVECVGKTLFRIMTAPNRELPLDPQWGMGAYLAIGAEGKAGKTWGDLRTIDLAG